MITTQIAALELGLSVRQVNALCQQHGIGQMVNPRLRVLTKADIAILKKVRQPVGNPTFRARAAKQ